MKVVCLVDHDNKTSFHRKVEKLVGKWLVENPNATITHFAQQVFGNSVYITILYEEIR